MWGSIHQDKIVLLPEHLGIIGQILDVLQSSSDELPVHEDVGLRWVLQPGFLCLLF